MGDITNVTENTIDYDVNAVSSRVIKKRMGELLVEQGVIREEELNVALKAQMVNAKPIGQNLVTLGFTTEKEIVKALSMQYGFPYLPLSNYTIPPDVVRLIPKEFALKHYLIPIDRIGNILTITMADPLDEEARREVTSITKYVVKTYVSCGTEIIDAIERYYGHEGQVTHKENSSDALGNVDFAGLLTKWKQKISLL